MSLPKNSPRPTETASDISILRALDAAANRAREALRVVEDFVRFALDDRHLTDCCKQLRHDLTAALAVLPMPDRLAARETQADVGTSLSTPGERSRSTPLDVLEANLGRLQEALRSLEEFGKIASAELGARIEQIRYRSYTLHRAIRIEHEAIQRLDTARLYVLVDGRSSLEEFRRLVATLVQAGVHVIQLRDKQMDDRTLLERARQLRQLTRDRATLFIMNDRPDLAVLADADGVHVGQEELGVKDARTIVGPRRLVGVSTHSIQQARQAVLDGANYIGVGPTFPSGTKTFDRFPGLELLAAVAAEIRLPAFAIGGIGPDNLDAVLSTGMRRVAASGAVCNSADPAATVRHFLDRLT